MSESSGGSRTWGRIYAVTAAGFASSSALWWSSGEYLRACVFLAMAGAWAIFALDQLRWPSKRPVVANVLLGGIVGWFLIAGYLTFT